MEVVWACMKGLTVEAERAERARVAGDAAALSDAARSVTRSWSEPARP